MTRASSARVAQPAIPATFSQFEGLPKTGPAEPERSSLLPGLAVTAAAVLLAWFVNRLAPAFSPLTCAVLLGAAVANARLLPRGAGPGLGFAGRRLMRAGIVLLGLKLALGDVLALGWETLAVTVTVVLLTFVGTQWLGRRMGLPGDQPLLVATGFSICGASAVAAMNSVTDSDEDDVVTSVALVTLCGTLAIVLLPLLHHPLGLTDPQFGRWVGASVHDVGQVVATAQTAGPGALDQAVVVKMMRIAMLAPLVASVALAKRRRTAAATRLEQVPAKRPPLVPLFVLGFLAMVALRSTGVVPTQVVNGSQDLANLLMAAGLFALGTGVDVRRLARTGGRALGLGLASWLLIATAAYLGVRLTT
ncbi:putative sulfate exporter family transporter [Actinospica durhamensis]|uniref:Sulfate exporter family transporter n=1 Tax=Actinospica durhamensis TaxID=1508375 RepID=A0A941EY42_9ACTN|nr:putative sulfate exporter family transporter [Actinospica durhamensis]MBR7836104.1 putative sulfate exporter family transporter [Actinospica durhamensis]